MRIKAKDLAGHLTAELKKDPAAVSALLRHRCACHPALSRDRIASTLSLLNGLCDGELELVVDLREATHVVEVRERKPGTSVDGTEVSGAPDTGRLPASELAPTKS